MTQIPQSIYEYPLYYDVLFGWDRAGEAAFYDAAFKHYGVLEAARILEVACGTGQIGIRLARMGWKVSGLDLSADMLAFLRSAAKDAGVTVETLCADMADFSVSRPFSAAFCPLGSLCMIPPDAALMHLRSMARALEPGGVYIIDLGFVDDPDAGNDPEKFRWSMTRGAVEVRSTIQGITVRGAARSGELELSWGPPLRCYTSRGFFDLVRESAGFAVEARHCEVRKTADSISVFDAGRTSPLDEVGRGMVVLRRTRRD